MPDKERYNELAKKLIRTRNEFAIEVVHYWNKTIETKPLVRLTTAIFDMEKSLNAVVTGRY